MYISFNITNHPLNIRVNRGNRKNRFFLMFLYNNEAEMAYIHIWRLYDYIYKFIIVVSNQTFSGLPKNVSFAPFDNELKKFKNKMDVVYFDNICNRELYYSSHLVWCLEQSQRDYAKYYIEQHYNPTENDFIIIVDIDEIITREGFEYIEKNLPQDYAHIKGAVYFPYYYHRLEDWYHPCIARYHKGMKSLSNLRGSPGGENFTIIFKDNPSRPLVTHCSYCFKNIEEYKNKLKSFPHQEFNRPPYITNDWIFRSHYCREKINSRPGYDEPYEGWKHLIPDDKRLKYLIDPSYMYPINETSYSEKDLENMCDRKYKRTPFE